jgi:hypothetical protein
MLAALAVAPSQLMMPTVNHKIWGASVPKLKGSTVQETGQLKPQSLVKVPRELLQLQQKVGIGIDIFFVNGCIFIMRYSRKICFTTVTHLINRKVSEVWDAMHKIYQMHMLCRFHIVELAGDGEISLYQSSLGLGRSISTCGFD